MGPWVCIKEGVCCLPGHAAWTSMAQTPSMLPPLLNHRTVLPQLTLVQPLTLLPLQLVRHQAVAWAQACPTSRLLILAADAAV